MAFTLQRRGGVLLAFGWGRAALSTRWNPAAIQLKGGGRPLPREASGIPLSLGGGARRPRKYHTSFLYKTLPRVKRRNIWRVFHTFQIVNDLVHLLYRNLKTSNIHTNLYIGLLYYLLLSVVIIIRQRIFDSGILQLLFCHFSFNIQCQQLHLTPSAVVPATTFLACSRLLISPSLLFSAFPFLLNHCSSYPFQAAR